MRSCLTNCGFIRGFWRSCRQNTSDFSDREKDAALRPQNQIDNFIEFLTLNPEGREPEMHFGEAVHGKPKPAPASPPQAV
jgi:hypothetical protein